ncbi:APC family permease [Arthrobacter sp. STN4]|uniref:APC family permease n=1 Tax=Arthrobacter sp. STN4 TaxID=2923276 RepID=UPI00211A7F7B|nr:APC family permease [Arthrobacter sp. STN4]MCQ9162732.1 APC family permease [Arthrobacter sp. STN4]
MDVKASAPTGGSLRRSISLGQLIFFGLVFIGPAAAVGIFGTLDAKSSGAVATVYVVATLVMAFTAASYMRMSREVPRAGSVFAYAGTGIGPRAGYVSGWMILLDYLLIPSVAYMFTGIALNSLFPAVPIWAFVAVAVVATTALNLAGVTVASKVVTAVVLLEVAVLLVVLACGTWVLSVHGPTRPWLSPFTGVGGFSVTAVMAAVSVAVLSFLGFDALATFAEEAKGSVRLVGRATMLCLVIAGVLFVAQSYVGALLSPTTPAQLAAHPGLEGAAYYTAVGNSIGPWLHWLLALSKAAGAAFAAMVGQGAGSRIIMDMARERRVPRALAKVSVRTGVPVRSILVTAAGNIVVALWAATRGDGLDILSSAVNVGALTAFILLHVSVIGYFLVKKLAPGNWFLHGAVPAVGAVLLVLVLASATPLALEVGLGWFVLGLVVAAIMYRRRAASGRAASGQAESGQAPPGADVPS